MDEDGNITRFLPGDNFTIIDNVILKDAEISQRTRGIAVYLLSLPATWNINVKNIHKSINVGRGAVLAAFTELQSLGYMLRISKQNDVNHNLKGGCVYQLAGFKKFLRQSENATPDTNRNQDEIQAGHNNIILLESNEDANASTNHLSHKKCRTKDVQNDLHKRSYGEDGVVLLTDEQLTKLHEVSSAKIIADYINRLNNYIMYDGKKYKSHYHVILNWMNRDDKSSVQTNKIPKHHAQTTLSQQEIEELKAIDEAFNRKCEDAR